MGADVGAEDVCYAAGCRDLGGFDGVGWVGDVAVGKEGRGSTLMVKWMDGLTTYRNPHRGGCVSRLGVLEFVSRLEQFVERKCMV